jgi:hypothetical protein
MTLGHLSVSFVFQSFRSSMTSASFSITFHDRFSEPVVMHLVDVLTALCLWAWHLLFHLKFSYDFWKYQFLIFSYNYQEETNQTVCFSLKHVFTDCNCTKDKISWEHTVVQFVEALRYKPKGRGFDSAKYHWVFSLTKSFWPQYGPGIDSASSRNEYQDISWGVKAADARKWHPYHLPEIWEPQPPGTLSAWPWLYRYCINFYMINFRVILSQCANIVTFI